jgi:hypothetical protein
MSQRFLNRHVLQKSCRAMVTSSSDSQPPLGSIRQLQQDLRSGATSAVSVARSYLDRVSETEPSIKSFLHVSEKEALEQAAAIDSALSTGKGDALGPLAGVPIGVKVRGLSFSVLHVCPLSFLQGERFSLAPPPTATTTRIPRVLYASSSNTWDHHHARVVFQPNTASLVPPQCNGLFV